MLLTLLMLALAFLLLTGVILVAVAGVFGFFFHGILQTALFVLKYFAPVLLIALILSFILRDREPLRVFAISTATLFVFELIFIFFWFTHSVNINIMPAEAVRQITFIEYFQIDEGTIIKDAEFGPSGIKHSSSERTYIDSLYEEVFSKEYTRTIYERINFKELSRYHSAVFKDENENTLAVVTRYGENIIGIEKNGMSSYYKAEDGVSEAPFTQLSSDILEEEKKAKAEAADKIWSGFVNELWGSVGYDDGVIHWTIPTQKPGDYRLNVNIMAKDKNNTGGYNTQRYNVQWDVEKNQDWEPGETYAFNFDASHTYSEYNLHLSVPDNSYTFDLLDIIPEENVYVYK